MRVTIVADQLQTVADLAHLVTVAEPETTAAPIDHASAESSLFRAIKANRRGGNLGIVADSCPVYVCRTSLT